MKVLMVCGCEINKENPITNFDFDQSLALKKSGVDVRIIALDCRTLLHSKRITTINKTINDIFVVCASLPVRLLPHGIKELFCRRKMLRMYKKFFSEWKPDIIHAQWGPNSFLISDVVKRYNIPLVVTEHCSKLNTSNPDKIYLKYSKKGYEKAKKRICVGSSLQKHLLVHTGYSFEIIGNVLDPLLFDNAFSIQKSKKSNKKIRIISAGHLIKSKNFIQLIDAMSLIKTVDYQLDIYGCGPEKSNLKNRVVNLGLSDRIVIHNEISRRELIKEFQKSDAFISLSLTETFGVVFIEAMACGLPVFSLKCGGTDDIIDSGGIGVILDTSDTGIISQKIEQFLKHLNLFDKESISQISLKRYGYDSFSKKLISLYSGVIYENA